jgi:hypothetical protein
MSMLVSDDVPNWRGRDVYGSPWRADEQDPDRTHE